MEGAHEIALGEPSCVARSHVTRVARRRRLRKRPTPLGPIAESPPPDSKGGTGSRGASRTDATSRRTNSSLRATERRTGESPRTRCTAHPVGYTSSFVICRFRRTRHRARRFCGRWARQRPRSQGGCAPAAPAPRRSRCEGRSESEQGEQRSSPLAIASPGRGRADQARGPFGACPLNKGMGRTSRPSGGIERSRASPESEEGNSERSPARQRWSSCRCPPAVVRRGESMPPAAFPHKGRCASLTMGRRSHRSEERR